MATINSTIMENSMNINNIDNNQEILNVNKNDCIENENYGYVGYENYQNSIIYYNNPTEYYVYPINTYNYIGPINYQNYPITTYYNTGPVGYYIQPNVTHDNIKPVEYYNYSENTYNAGTCSEYDASYTTFNNNFTKMSIVKAYNLPLQSQKPLERYFKIISLLTLLKIINVGIQYKLIYDNIIKKANIIVKKICSIKNNYNELIESYDIKLQEIEEDIIKMCDDAGFTFISTLSTKTLKLPKKTIVNVPEYKQTERGNEVHYNSIILHDDKCINVKRIYDCLNVRETQVQVTYKIFINNISNINILGKLIGIGGTKIKHIEKSTGSKICIRGVGSFDNRRVGDNKYWQKNNNQLIEPLHLLITAFGTSEVGGHRRIENIRNMIISTLSQ